MTPPPWALGFGDEVWWSRLAPPAPPCWTDAAATPQWQARTAPTEAPDPQARACDGRLVRPQPPQGEQRWRRFVAGRPGRAVTIAFRAWCSAQLAAQGCTAWRLIGDNAAWHRRPAGRPWRRQPKQQVKRGAGGVRGGVGPWPSTSPWLNPMEPQWVDGKRAVSALDRLLSAAALEARLDAYDGGQGAAHLNMPKKVA